MIMLMVMIMTIKFHNRYIIPPLTYEDLILKKLLILDISMVILIMMLIIIMLILLDHNINSNINGNENTNDDDNGISFSPQITGP